MDKFFMIELMLLQGRISADRAESLIHAHVDEVESEWLNTAGFIGAFVVTRVEMGGLK